MIDDFFEPLVFIEKRTQSDGMGGFIEQYTEGVQFKGSIITNQTLEARIAEQEGVKSIYTITTRKNVPLKYGDIIQRKKDNEYFRITSKDTDMESPKVSTLNIHQVTAESFTIPSI